MGSSADVCLRRGGRGYGYLKYSSLCALPWVSDSTSYKLSMRDDTVGGKDSDGNITIRT